MAGNVDGIHSLRKSETRTPDGQAKLVPNTSGCGGEMDIIGGRHAGATPPLVCVLQRRHSGGVGDWGARPGPHVGKRMVLRPGGNVIC